jgi:hypothetical protein
MRVLATGWSAYTLWRTSDLKSIVNHLIVNQGTPCETGLNVFPKYFSTRLAFQVHLLYYYWSIALLMMISADS